MSIVVNNVIPTSASIYSAAFGLPNRVFRIFPFPTVTVVTNTVEIPAPPRVRVTQYQQTLGGDIEDFGTDTPVFPDLDESATLYGGRTILADHLLRRLLTRKGTMPMLPDYGIDIRDSLSDKVTSESLFALKASIENELTEDERVLSASATLDYSLSTETLTIDIAVELETGPFQFSVRLNQLDVQLLLGETNAANI